MRLKGVLSNGRTVTTEGSSKKDFFGLAVLLKFLLDRSEHWKGFSMHHNKMLAEAEAKNKVREGYLDSVIVPLTVISKREIPVY